MAEKKGPQEEPVSFGYPVPEVAFEEVLHQEDLPHLQVLCLIESCRQEYVDIKHVGFLNWWSYYIIINIDIACQIKNRNLERFRSCVIIVIIQDSLYTIQSLLKFHEQNHIQDYIQANLLLV